MARARSTFPLWRRLWSRAQAFTSPSTATARSARAAARRTCSNSLACASTLPPESVAPCHQRVSESDFFLRPPCIRPRGMPCRRGANSNARTVFNLLGPLTNPAGASAQVVGVYDASLTELMARALGELGVRRAFVVHGADGLDEISISGATYVAELQRRAGPQLIQSRRKILDCGGRRSKPFAAATRSRTPRSFTKFSAARCFIATWPAPRNRACQCGRGAGRSGSRGEFP